jgi:hypothetical protein
MADAVSALNFYIPMAGSENKKVVPLELSPVSGTKFTPASVRNTRLKKTAKTDYSQFCSCHFVWFCGSSVIFEEAVHLSFSTLLRDCVKKQNLSCGLVRVGSCEFLDKITDDPQNHTK